MGLSRKDKKLLAIVFFSVGTPFIIAGIIILLFVPSFINREGQEVAQLPTVTVATIQNSTPINEKVVIEGLVSQDNPVGEIPLVAYQEYYRQDNVENRTTWKKGILVNPKLLISVSDGLIELESGYTINQSATSIRAGKRRTYSGFAISDRIFIVGIVTNNEEKIPRIKAERIAAAENKAEYLKTMNRNALVFHFMGIGFLCLGVVFDTSAFVLMTKKKNF